MCLRKIKQILWPTNQLGKDKQSVVFPRDEVMSLVDMDTRMAIVPFSWIGDRLIIRFTEVQKAGVEKSKYVSQEYVFTNGDGSTQQIDVVWLIAAGFVHRLNSDMYFDCTNVTSLIVNGEQYI